MNWEDMLIKVEEKKNDKLVLEDILKENEEIFRDELGTMKEKEATLVLKPGILPSREQQELHPTTCWTR